MRAVRFDVFRENHQNSLFRDKIGQGKVYYREAECITKLYLGPRMTDADKRKIEEALAQLARQEKKVCNFRSNGDILWWSSMESEVLMPLERITISHCRVVFELSAYPTATASDYDGKVGSLAP